MFLENRRRGASFLYATAVAVCVSGCGPSAEQPGPVSASTEIPTGHPGVSAASLVASYDMSTLTSDGQLADLSGRELHGRVLGTEALDSPMGGALAFGAVTDRVELPADASLDLDGPLSVALWFRFDTPGQHQHILACDDKFAVWLTPDDHVRFVNTLGDGAETASPLSTGSWYSVVGVFRGTAGDPIDSDNVEIWVNGSRASSTVASAFVEGPARWQGGELYDTEACFIGFESHQGEPRHQELPFFGSIDEVRVFGRALGETEIQLLAGVRR